VFLAGRSPEGEKIMSNWGDLFSFRPMKELAKYLSTYNMETQAIAVDGAHVYNIQSTGTKQCVINGIYIPALTADAELLITSDEITTMWAAGTEYSADDTVKYGNDMFVCLVDHKAVNRPMQGDGFWRALPNAAGYELADDYRIMLMVTAQADGTLGLWLASDPCAIGTAPTTKIPAFDPSVYCVVAFIDYANDAASAAVTFGDTDGGVAFGTDGTFYQVIGPVFPHPDNFINN
jgi:hypothetical protein